MTPGGIGGSEGGWGGVGGDGGTTGGEGGMLTQRQLYDEEHDPVAEGLRYR